MAEDLGKVFDESNIKLLYEFDKEHGSVHEAITLNMYRNRMWIETKRTIEDSFKMFHHEGILDMTFKKYIAMTWSESNTPPGVPKPTPVRKMF